MEVAGYPHFVGVANIELPTAVLVEYDVMGLNHGAELKIFTYSSLICS